MKLGVFTVLFGDRSLDDTLAQVKEAGLDAVELGTGGFPGADHVPVKSLLSSVKTRTEFLAKIGHYGLTISALSCHGNPLHPSKKVSKPHHDAWQDTVKLARMLNVDTVVVFSGCPGDHDRARKPNWVTCAWPPDFADVLEWQWDKKLLPYWREEARFAQKQGINVAFEMHPGFCVYNPQTLLKLRDACGENVGANVDPSHLFWQGIDPIAAVRALSGCIYHVHAKDTAIDAHNTLVNGVLDTTPYDRVPERAWTFRTVGFGHDAQWWKDFASALRLAGYDGVLSIEHEDPLMSIDEGFRRAVAFLRGIIFAEAPSQPWWT